MDQSDERVVMQALSLEAERVIVALPKASATLPLPTHPKNYGPPTCG